MHIRPAISSDLPKIIQVLKASLGEEDLPLSEEIWNFKHVENPFGKSLILIAEDRGHIAGVRAFMKWEWVYNGISYKTYRAVDTATHPQFQGRGIFKKLTLEALRLGMDNLENFVFNTPNDQSRPGYLKMGWKQVGKIQVALHPAFNSFLKISPVSSVYEIKKTSSPNEIEDLCSRWNDNRRKDGKLFTPKSADYLSWRFENNPLQQYEVASTSKYYLSGYIKKRNMVKELRIAECIFTDKEDLKLIKKLIHKWSSKFGAQIITYSPKFLDLGPISYKGALGPILTFRELELSQREINLLQQEKNWNYSIGDLELF
ncbi:GNAT family N-acetyltransferase [Antarcticibacterium arcticum]|uniref:GNAT family N-acetyltransferase n=1 Tax=Antarcticibacterium arcticum TaxID=2585771 RepID=A0A5B8YHH0_9FLAO|nr:GNAT family N-acetyltransferase [Antarcticibacterium arcticum]QED36528.1 GNAT family N-acetyltransferase [Antarcticibacterium arcticum]